MADITDTIARSRPDPDTLRPIDTTALLTQARRQTVARRTVGAGLVTAGAIGVAVAVAGIAGSGLPGIDHVEPATAPEDVETGPSRQAEARRLFASCTLERGFEVTDLQIRVTRDGLEVASGAMMSIPQPDEPTGDEYTAAWMTCSDEVAEAFRSQPEE